MTIPETLKGYAARLGFHVVRNYRDPSHTFMGMTAFNIGTVLDVGANSGQFARDAFERFPGATFHCFEPTPSAFAELQAWAATQRRVVPVQLAIGDQPGSLDMHLHTQHTTSSSLLATTAQNETYHPFMVEQTKIQVSIERLDDYVARLISPLVGEILLKIDVQGYETLVLRGAPETLKKVRACIVEVNIDHLYEGQSQFSDIVALMTAAGLHYAGNFNQEFGADGHVMYLDAVFARRSQT